MPDFIDPSLGSYLRVLYLLCDCIISYINVFPANIFDLQDCLKTFSRLILKTSRRLLHDVLLRRVQDVLEDVFDTSSRRLERKEIVTLKTSSRRLEDMCVFKIFSRRFQDVLETKKMFTGRESISLSDERKSVSEKSIFNKSIPDKSKANPKQILDALIRTQ